MTSDASTVIEEAISKGTARKDLEEEIDQETDIEMTGEGDQEVEIDHHADPPEMTQDPWIEVEATEIIVTAEDMVVGMTTKEMIVVTTEEAEVDAIEEGITLVTGMIDPPTETTNLGPELHHLETKEELIQGPQEEIDLPKDLTDPTTEEIDLSKKVVTLPFKTRNCPITTNNLRTTKMLKTALSSRWNQRILSQTVKSQRKLKLQLSRKLRKKLILSNPQLISPKTSEI